jgi:hypothetical protein
MVMGMDGDSAQHGESEECRGADAGRGGVGL